MATVTGKKKAGRRRSQSAPAASSTAAGRKQKAGKGSGGGGRESIPLLRYDPAGDRAEMLLPDPGPAPAPIHAAWIIASLDRTSAAPEGQRQATSALHKFKSRDQGAARCLTVIEAAAARFECRTIVACPGSETVPSRLQEHFGVQLERQEGVERRKGHHDQPVPPAEAETVHVNPDMPSGRILLVDVFCISGGRLNFCAELLKSEGHSDLVKFTLGISARLNPQHIGHLEIQSTPAGRKTATATRTTPKQAESAVTARTGGGSTADSATIPEGDTPARVERRKRHALDCRQFRAKIKNLEDKLIIRTDEAFEIVSGEITDGSGSDLGKIQAAALAAANLSPKQITAYAAIFDELKTEELL